MEYLLDNHTSCLNDDTIHCFYLLNSDKYHKQFETIHIWNLTYAIREVLHYLYPSDMDLISSLNIERYLESSTNFLESTLLFIQKYVPEFLKYASKINETNYKQIMIPEEYFCLFNYEHLDHINLLRYVYYNDPSNLIFNNNVTKKIGYYACNLDTYILDEICNDPIFVTSEFYYGRNNLRGLITNFLKEIFSRFPLKIFVTPFICSNPSDNILERLDYLLPKFSYTSIRIYIHSILYKNCSNEEILKLYNNFIDETIDRYGTDYVIDISECYIYQNSNPNAITYYDNDIDYLFIECRLNNIDEQIFVKNLCQLLINNKKNKYLRINR